MTRVRVDGFTISLDGYEAGPHQEFWRTRVESAKRLQMLGIVFFSFGITFLAVGIATKMSTFYLVSPAFLTLGIVFFAKSKTPQE